MRLEIRRSRERVKTLCAGRKISMRMERNFCAHENLFPCAQKIFSCAQKFLGFRREISLRQHALSSTAR